MPLLNVFCFLGIFLCGYFSTQPAASTPVPCHDILDNCETYGPDACRNVYKNWADKNCRRYCGFCVSGGLEVPTSPDPVPTHGTCHDFINTCPSYGIDTCSNYVAWSRQNCPSYCGFCNASVAAQICEDKVKCSTYASDICTKYAPWSKLNCARTCGLCPTAPTPGSNIHISGSLPPTFDGCTYAGKVYRQDEKWTVDCDWNCTCSDASTGYYECRSLCLTWNLPKECQLEKPPGKCCGVPKCPANILVKYPPGYHSA